MNFLQGSLDMLILSALTAGPRHGYDIVEWIRTTTDGVLQIDDGALYASLHRMEQRGAVDSEWRTSPKGRRAKYYRLTAVGRRQLRLGELEWSTFAEAVARIRTARREMS